MIALAQALVVALAVPFARTPLQLFVAAVVAGAALGAGHAASRALLTTCIPRGTEAEAFGFYAVCGKLASPTHSLLPALLLPRVGLGPVSLATGLLVLLGFLLVSRLPGGAAADEPSRLPGSGPPALDPGEPS